MKLTKKNLKPGVVVVELAGRISMGKDCEEIDESVEQHILQNEKHIIFDLTGVHHIDSAVVGQIVKSHSRLVKSGGKMRIAGASGMVEGVLKMTHVVKVIELYHTVADASQNFPQ
ncbi:MAG: STAS domain-containing protein [Candidatus Acidiferrales bacterium]